MNLVERLLRECEAKSRDRVLLELEDGSRWSCGALVDLSARLAHALEHLGALPGARVAVQVEKSPEALALYLACLRLGAVFLPLNTAYTPREVAFFLSDAEPAVFVGGPGIERPPPTSSDGGCAFATLGSARDGTLLELAQDRPVDYPVRARAPQDLAAIVYTSGTTGRSKGAMLTHENLLSNAEALVQAWSFHRDDVLLHALPMYHVHGLFVAIHTVLLSGGSFLWLPKFEADPVLRLLPRATVFMGVPTYYSRLLARPGLTLERVRDVRLFTSGSAPLSSELHRAFRERTGHAILERYGMTETGMNTSNPYEGDRVAGTVGLPLPGVELRITDPVTGAELSRGGVGRIEVRGRNVFPGYWRMPERTKEEFRPDGYFVTGDLGRIDERGYVTILGRGKDLVITGGLNVYPKEIEDEIDRLPGIAECAVLGVPHPDFGEAVVAVVVLEAEDPHGSVPSSSSSAAGGPIAEQSGERVIEALRGRLAGFKLPKRVLVVHRIPRNSMGKIEKARLRETYAHLFDEEGTASSA